VDLTRVPHGVMDSETVALALMRPPAPLSDEEQTLLDTIVASPERFLDSGPPHAVLNQAELVFFAAGRSLELAPLYAAAVERQGQDSALRVRLALLLQRLGMFPSAEREARLAVQHRPADPDAHYVLGNLLAQGEDRSAGRLAEIAGHWERVFELAPDYEPLDGSRAEEVRERLQQVRALGR
jgi:tetratricopeptide (TPR) repeat protein